MARSFPGDSTPALLRLALDGETVDVRHVVDSTGARWWTAEQAGSLLGLTSDAVRLLAGRQRAKLAGEQTTALISVQGRYGERRVPVLLFSRAALDVLADAARANEAARLRRAKLLALIPLTEAEAVAELRDITAEALARAEAVRRSQPKGSESRALALDVRNSFREAAAVLDVHAGTADLEAQGLAMSALLGRDVPSTKGDPANGWDRLLGAADGRRS